MLERGVSILQLLYLHLILVVQFRFGQDKYLPEKQLLEVLLNPMMHKICILERLIEDLIIFQKNHLYKLVQDDKVRMGALYLKNILDLKNGAHLYEHKRWTSIEL